jgi:hypothetical protein
MAVVAFLAGTTIAAWLALSPDRGLDLTDEGLYLLAADPPSSGASWGWPFGWNTGLLFDLTGHQIAIFRLLGAVMLAGAFAGLGLLVARTAQVSPALVHQSRRVGLWASLVGLGVGFFGAAFYYAGFHRTPSYNWLNLFAILISLVGVLYAVHGRDQGFGRARYMASAAIISLGFVLSFPAKPTTPFFFALSVLPLVIVSLGLRRSMRLALLVAALTLAWLGLAVVSGIWPFGSLRIFYDTLGQPALATSQSLRGAFVEFTYLPDRLMGEIRAQADTTKRLFVAGLIVGLLGCLSRRPRSPLVMVGFAAVVVASLSVAMIELPNPLAAAPVFRWNFPPIVTGMWMIVIAAVVLAAGRVVVHVTGMRRVDSAVVRAVLLAVALLCQPLIFGFGSAHGLYNQGFLAAGFFPLVALVLAFSFGGQRMGVGVGVLLLVFVAVLAGVTIRDSRQVPIRIASMSLNTAEIDLGERGGKIKVDPDLADLIRVLSAQASNAGWKPGTPMIGLGWHWSATIPYVLGATTPKSLMVTIYGMPGSYALAKHTISAGLGDFNAPSAWLMLSSPRVLDVGAEREVAATLDELTRVTGLAFPEDYECVIEAGQVQLWKPNPSRGARAGHGTCATNSPAGSDYSLMWGYTGNLSY